MNYKKGQTRPDFQVSCPFNFNHKMPFSKILFHISKGCKDKREKGTIFEV